MTQEISKNKGDVISQRLPLGISFGGCLLIERLRSSGAKSGLLHLLACRIRCGMDALHFELEVVRIAGVLQGGFIADQALRVQIVEGLVERLHTVLGGAGANGLTMIRLMVSTASNVCSVEKTR